MQPATKEPHRGAAREEPVPEATREKRIGINSLNNKLRMTIRSHHGFGVRTFERSVVVVAYPDTCGEGRREASEPGVPTIVTRARLPSRPARVPSEREAALQTRLRTRGH